MNSLTFEARVNAEHLVVVPDEIPVGTLVRVHVEPLTDDPLLDNYQPRTKIGRMALAARRAYIEAGGKLLSWDEIDEEVRQRRGGIADFTAECTEKKLHHRGHGGHREEEERRVSDD